MGALKGLVIGLGLTIVLVVGLMVWGLYKKSEDPSFKMFTFSEKSTSSSSLSDGASAPMPSGIVPAWGTVSLNLPQGCAVTGVSAQGTRMLVLSGATDQAISSCARVTVIETGTGRILGTVVGGP